MRYRTGILLVTLAAISMALFTCGKKAPPFLPERTMPLRVGHLEAGRESGTVILRGSIIGPQGISFKNKDIIGCRVYHVWYSLTDAPCEGCPINYRGFKEIKGEVTQKGKFYCPFPGIEKKGFHFFEVQLIGKNGALGARSNRTKLRIDE